jgi:flagellar protein FliO/FliZ
MLLASGYSGLLACIKLILVFVFVLILAYYGARIAGNYQNNVLNSRSNIRIIESYRVGGNKLLAIAKIGEDYYAIGIGKDEFTLIDKLDGAYFDALMAEREAGKTAGISMDIQKLGFKDILSNVRKSKANDEMADRQEEKSNKDQ